MPDPSPAHGSADDNRAASLDPLLGTLADYILDPPEPSAEALATARLCLRDSIGCALEALGHPACVAHLGPVVPGAGMAAGARALGTGTRLDPVKAAFDNGTLIRWLDFNDTWLAAEWGHPSDNFGGLLALADYRGRNPDAFGLGAGVTVGEVLRLGIQAHEIQGVLALANSFNRVGLDHVLLVKVASAGLAARLCGGGRDAVTSALGHAFIDGHSLRTYRHAPNAMQRKSWAAGDATSRGVRLALMACTAGLPGLASALSAPRWGFNDVLFQGAEPVLAQGLGCYVMENVLFKVSFPAEFHAQTAVEAAISLHAQVANRADAISRVELRTQEAAVRIISKTGALRNFADRDHCLQYMVAVGLLEGTLTAGHYSDTYAAATPQVDRLRELMEVQEDPAYSTAYLDPARRAIPNAVRVHFHDGTATEWAEVEYPLGHRRRRDEARGPLRDKFMRAASVPLGPGDAEDLADLFDDPDRLDALAVPDLIDLTCPRG